MLTVIRRLLTMLLLVSLPIQGWASMRMAIDMAVGHAVHQGAAGPSAEPIATALSHAGHAGHVGHDRDAEQGGHASDCCATHDDASAGSEGSHGACEDSCHCCISSAPPATGLQLHLQGPPLGWLGLSPCGFAQATAHALDKPPKG